MWRVLGGVQPNVNYTELKELSKMMPCNRLESCWENVRTWWELSLISAIMKKRRQGKQPTWKQAREDENLKT